MSKSFPGRRPERGCRFLLALSLSTMLVACSSNPSTAGTESTNDPNASDPSGKDPSGKDPSNTNPPGGGTNPPGQGKPGGVNGTQSTGLGRSMFPGAGDPQSDPTPRAGVVYFEKTGRSLDFMGVAVSARTNNKSQRVWAPGSQKQEYPGGWVTPGEYIISINTRRLHHEKSGRLNGQTRATHQLMGVITKRTLTDPGWINHSVDDPKSMKPQQWGQSKIVKLQAGDTLHVAYGNKVVAWQKRAGSDGIVVHCVEKQPEFRGGLWGQGTTLWSKARWDVLVNRMREAAKIVKVKKGNFYWGPQVLPAILPSDLAMDTGDLNNKQAQNLGRWLNHRGMDYLKTGKSWSTAKKLDLKRLFEFFCNNPQLCFLWSDRSGQFNTFTHGFPTYSPNQIDAIVAMLPAAVALGYTPSYEPLHRLLCHLAQRCDMTLALAGSYTWNNDMSDGGLSAHRQDDRYTQWLWNDLGIRDMNAKGSHRHKVWGPCLWARELLNLPLSKASQDTLWYSGKANGRHGHEFTDKGVVAGYGLSYCHYEIEGAMWLWFTRTQEQSQFNRFARRSFLYSFKPGARKETTYPGYYAQWAQDSFVAEAKGLVVARRGDCAHLTWVANLESDISHYRVYWGSEPRRLPKMVDSVKSLSFSTANFAKGQTVYFAVSAVDKSGNEGSLSDQVKIVF